MEKTYINKETYEKDEHGKISNTSLSSYGKSMLNRLDGLSYEFNNGDIAYIQSGKIFVNGKQEKPTDRLVNKLTFLVL